IGIVESGAVNVGSVVTAHVDNSALRRVDFDHEMDAGKILVLERELEMGVPGPAHQKGVVAGKRKFQSLVRPSGDRQRDAHKGSEVPDQGSFAYRGYSIARRGQSEIRGRHRRASATIRNGSAARRVPR